MQEAIEAIKRIRSDIHSSVEDVVQFVRIAAIKTWNIRAKIDDQLGFCELNWTGPDYSLNDAPADQMIELFPAIVADFRVQRGRYSDAYVVSPALSFWFRAPDEASRYIQLVRKAAELCDNWP